LISFIRWNSVPRTRAHAVSLLNQVLRVLRGRIAPPHDEDVLAGERDRGDVERIWDFSAEGMDQSGFCGRPRIPMATAQVLVSTVRAGVSTRSTPRAADCADRLAVPHVEAEIADGPVQVAERLPLREVRDAEDPAADGGEALVVRGSPA